MENSERYSRQILLKEIGVAGQQKLRLSKVLVVGAGGLGCPVLMYLASAGVGNIGIADDDRVHLTNLHRQIIYSLSDIGKHKAMVAAAHLKASNEDINVEVYNLRLDASNALSVIPEYDIVIDCTDNFASRYLLNDVCVLLKKKLVYGSVYRFEGQLSVFDGSLGPTYRCLYPHPPVEGSILSCAEVGVVGATTGIIGTLMAMETIKIILGIATTLSGRLLVYNALEAGFREMTFDLNTANLLIDTLQDYHYQCDTSLKPISPTELRKLIQLEDQLQLIDVRQPEEHAVFDIGGINIPLGSVEKNIHTIRRDCKVVIYCQSGIRSSNVITMLEKEYNFTNLYNLENGLNGWEINRVV